MDRRQGELSPLSLSLFRAGELTFSFARTPQEKVDEEGPQPLELEVQIIALRRKKGGEGA